MIINVISVGPAQRGSKKLCDNKRDNKKSYHKSYHKVGYHRTPSQMKSTISDRGPQIPEDDSNDMLSKDANCGKCHHYHVILPR